MFCPKCGSENTEKYNFCIKCGNPIISHTNYSNSSDSVTQFTPKPIEQPYIKPQPVEPPYTKQSSELIITKKSTSKRTILLTAVISVVVTVIVIAITYFVFGNRANDRRIEGSGYATAEDAVSAYLEAFCNADIEAMLSTFAVETFAENYDLEAQIERVQAYMITLQQSLPSNNQFTTRLNIQRRQGQIADAIRFQYMSIFIPNAINDGQITRIDDKQAARNFIKTLGDQSYYDSMRMLKIVGFISPGRLHDMYTSEQNQRNIDKTMEIIGAQRLENVVARVKINHQIYLFCFDVARYGEKWYIHSLGGNIGALLGIPVYAMGVIPEADLP